MIGGAAPVWAAPVWAVPVWGLVQLADATPGSDAGGKAALFDGLRSVVGMDGECRCGQNDSGGGYFEIRRCHFRRPFGPGAFGEHGSSLAPGGDEHARDKVSDPGSFTKVGGDPDWLDVARYVLGV